MRKSTENYISKTTKEGSTIINTLYFVYDNYTLIQPLNESNQSTQEFVWEPTAGSATRPLFLRLPGQAVSLLYCHDANKNVTEVVYLATANGIGAHYEYDSFGNTITSTRNTRVSSPDLRTYNPFRFSSEYHDDELNLIYYNYRHYNPTSGRWLSRDPIAEEGGYNLYGICNNNTVTFVDFLGLAKQNDELIEISKLTDIIRDIFKGSESGGGAGGILVTDVKKRGEPTFKCEKKEENKKCLFTCEVSYENYDIKIMMNTTKSFLSSGSKVLLRHELVHYLILKRVVDQYQPKFRALKATGIDYYESSAKRKAINAFYKEEAKLAKQLRVDADKADRDYDDATKHGQYLPEQKKWEAEYELPSIE